MCKDYKYYNQLINDHLVDCLPEVDPKSETVYEAMEYSLKAGGKRLRPVLLLAACDFCGGNIKDAMPYAMAVEYIHTYSLIHDDLPCIDDDNLRRGKATNHVIFGEAMATLAGDGLLNSAYETMIKDMLMDFDNEVILKRKIRGANAIAKAAGCRGMIAGQVADIESEGKKYSGEMMDYIHSNKTGEMIVGSIRAGAYIAGAQTDTLNDLTEYGECLGLAFQICDDILDVTGSTEKLGKEVGHDELTEKMTYPSLYGMEYSQQKLRELNERAFNAIDKYDEKADFFRDLIKRLADRQK